MKGLIGVLGGMGPAATMDLFNKFIMLTPAKCDQEHIPLIISSIPDIPDRTGALLYGGKSPLPLMKKYLHLLENAGAECIIIPCNTAHYWFYELKKFCHVKMLSIIESTINEVCNSGKTNIGLLATDATIYMGLYQQKIEAEELNCIIPDTPYQKIVMKSIYLLKSGEIDKSKVLMEKVAQYLFDQGAEVIILGCTEIPIILQSEINKSRYKYIDSTSALVKASITWYKEEMITKSLF